MIGTQNHAMLSTTVKRLSEGAVVRSLGPVVIFILLLGAAGGWVLGSAATRYGRAGRDVVAAKTTWRKAVGVLRSERGRTGRVFLLGIGVLIAIAWMAAHTPGN